MEIARARIINATQNFFELFTSWAEEVPPRKNRVHTVDFFGRDIIKDEFLKFPMKPPVI
jgi:hypothetical protein